MKLFQRRTRKMLHWLALLARINLDDDVSKVHTRRPTKKKAKRASASIRIFPANALMYDTRVYQTALGQNKWYSQRNHPALTLLVFPWFNALAFYAAGVFSGNIIIRYFAVPLTYLEAGLLCDPKSLYLTLSNGYLLVFTMIFVYGLMPFLMRLGVCLLTYANVNVWLLKGMEVLYCMPPPFNTSLVLCRLAQADLSTSIVITLVSHFGGLFISPVLLYFVLGASTPPLVGVDVKETIYSTIIPLVVGIAIQSFVLTKYDFCFKVKSPWFSQGLLLATAYHWFCDAISVDASSLQATDVLLCVLIACVGQLFVSCLCWTLCSRWLPRNVLVAALFTCTHKSVGLGSWVLRGAYHGSAHGPAVNLPLSVLPVAQLLLGSLLASWLSP